MMDGLLAIDRKGYFPEAILALPGFWRGAAATRAELRERYAREYSDELKLLDAQRRSEIDRIESHCRSRLPLSSSRDYRAWFWRWRDLGTALVDKVGA